MSRVAHLEPNVVRLKRLRIDTYQEPVIFMTRDCPVCRSEGWTSQQRVDVTLDHHSIIATLNVVDDALLSPDEASLSDAPADLRERAVDLAGRVLEIGGVATPGCGRAMAADVLTSGRALAKFEAICAAQGGIRTPPVAPLQHVQLDTVVSADEPLFTIHAEAPGELQYAQSYLATNPQVITLEEA